MKKKKGMKLFILLSALSIIPLVVSVMVVSMVSVGKIKSNLEDDSEEKLSIVASNLASHCRENNLSYATSSNYNDYLDSLQDEKIEMIIILDGAPCVASIKNDNGYRVREIEFTKDFTKDKDELLKGYYDKDIKIEGKDYYGYYMPIESDGTLIGMACALELTGNVADSIKNIRISFIVVAIILTVCFAFLALLLSRLISKAFLSVNGSVKALSQGDLSSKKMRRSLVREMNLLLGATEVMQKNLSDTIGKVKGVSTKLVDNVKEVTGLSENSATRAMQITSAVDELSKATTEMADNVQGISDQMYEIDKCVNDIADSVEALNTSTENILTTNHEAGENMRAIMESSVKSVQAVDEIATQINETNESIKEISTVVELILSIAEQSSLLSLNASIEAARAGEHGRGFSVVASEINKLSNQSAEGAEKIRTLADTIIGKSSKSVELVENVHDFISSEQEAINQTQDKYHTLSDAIDQSAHEINAISDKTDHLAEYKVKVIGNVQDLSAISQQNAASNEEVSSNISDILDKVQTVNKHCETMNKMAEELEKTVTYFRN